MKKPAVILVLLTILVFTGCVYHQAIKPIGDGKYLVEAEMDWSRGTTEARREEKLRKLAETACPDYKVESKSTRYNMWSEAFTVQWIISCP